jgi:hypothetical protein
MAYFPGWTYDTEAELKRMVGEKMSALGIAKKLGLTRNAVIGKCSRMGLQLDGDPRVTPDQRRALAGGRARQLTAKPDNDYRSPSTPRRFSWEEPLDTPSEHA